LQVGFLGYPGSCAAPWIDALIADEVTLPVEMEDAFPEQVWRLPCYQVNARAARPNAAATRASHGLPEQALIFVSFNHPLKLNLETVQDWLSILKGVPGSVLWLLDPGALGRHRLHKMAHTQGIDPGRLILAPRLPQDSHLSRLALADLALDPHVCGGHTTTSDALWMGVPVLTRLGSTFQSRVSASLLHACDLRELVAVDRKEYVERAIALGRHPDQLRQFKHRLSETVPSAFDAEHYARAFLQCVRGKLRQVE